MINKASISGPKNPQKLPPGPNQLAGALEHTSPKLKSAIVDFQKRPAAFYEGSQATRKLAGRDVAISSPLVGIRFPQGKAGAGKGAAAKAQPQAAPGDSRALVRRESGREGAAPQDLASAEGGHNPQALVKRETPESPARLTAPPEHVPTPLPSPPSPATPETPARPASPRPQDTRPHVDPGLEMLHYSQPGGHIDGPPPPYSERPTQHQAAPEQGGKPTHDADMPPEGGKKGMSLGKKVLIGVGAFFGIMFLTSGGSSTPPAQS